MGDAYGMTVVEAIFIPATVPFITNLRHHQLPPSPTSAITITNLIVAVAQSWSWLVHQSEQSQGKDGARDHSELSGCALANLLHHDRNSRCLITRAPEVPAVRAWIHVAGSRPASSPSAALRPA